MFGHQDEPEEQTESNPTSNSVVAPTADGSLSSDNATSVSDDSGVPTMPSPTPTEPAAVMSSVSTPLDTNSPVSNPEPVDDEDEDKPMQSLPASTEPVEPVMSSGSGSPDVSADNLLDIKQQVLETLSPLVSHLDQTPEEKYHTTMMMIHATDDKSLIPVAFEAAKSIKEDKLRAQALLDIVNEINYFTHYDKD